MIWGPSKLDLIRGNMPSAERLTLVSACRKLRRMKGHVRSRLPLLLLAFGSGSSREAVVGEIAGWDF